MNQINLEDLASKIYTSNTTLYNMYEELSVEFSGSSVLDDTKREIFLKSVDIYVSVVKDIALFEKAMKSFIEPESSRVRRLLLTFSGQLSFFNCKKEYLKHDGTSESDADYILVSKKALDVDNEYGLNLKTDKPLSEVPSLEDKESIKNYFDTLYADSEEYNLLKSVSDSYGKYLLKDTRTAKEQALLGDDTFNLTVSFGHWYIILSRMLDFGGSLYTGLPSKDNLKEFLTIANIHIESVFYLYEHLVEVTTILKSDIKNIANSWVYISMADRMGGFLQVVNSYINMLEPIRDTKTTKYDKYVHYHSMVKSLHQTFISLKPSKIRSGDIVYDSLKELITFTHALEGYKGEGKHYREDMIPVLEDVLFTQNRVYQRVALNSAKTKKVDLLTNAVLDTINFIVTTYLDMMIHQFTVSAFNGEWDKSYTPALWHESRFEYLTTKRTRSEKYIRDEKEIVEETYQTLFKMFSDSKVYPLQ